MTRNTKIVIAVVVVLALLCICGCAAAFFFLQSAGQFLERSAVTNPAEVATIGDSIADYQLPPGYSEQFGMNLFGFSIVGFTDQTEQMLIMLMQFPEFAGLSQEEMEQQMRKSVQQQAGIGDAQLEPVDQTTATIRDQNVQLTISEGTDSNGRSVRQVTGVFQGRGGPTLLMIMGPIDGWDQAAVDSFLASLS